LKKSDFKEKDVKDYFGLALDKPKWIRLKYADVIIKLEEIIKDNNGNPIELKCVYDDKGEIKGKKVIGTIHWVSEPEPGKEPLKVEIRNYDHLFLSENPLAKGKDGWMEDINPKSLIIFNAYVDNSILGLKPLDKVQFERIGYYCVDTDSTPTHLVFNRTVSLKESKGKKALKNE
jgi:glutaminyl-tRNA synthetase